MDKLRDFKGIVNDVIGVCNLTNLRIDARKDYNIYATNATVDEFLFKFLNDHFINEQLVDFSSLSNWLLDTHQESSVISLTNNNSKQLKYSIKKKFVDNFIYFYILDLTPYENVFLMYDPLTKLLTRDSITALINHDLENRDEKPFSLIYLDIDNFKLINDLYGHLVGDKVLQIVGKKLKERFPNSRISRLGGDEFLILNYGPTKYETLHDFLHLTLNKNDEILKDNDIPVSLVFGKNSVQDDKTFRITFTAGVSRCPLDGTTIDELLLKADKALHRGKIKGKRCFIIYLDEMHKDINLDGSYNGEETRADLAYKRFTISLLDILNGDLSVRQKINKYLKKVCEFMGLDRVVLSKKTENDLVYYQGYANNYIDASLEFIDKKISGDYIFNSLSDKTVVVNSVYYMKDAQMKEIATRQNTKSFIRVPLKYENNIIGYLRFDAVTQERKFSIGDETVAKCVSKILTTFLYSLNSESYLNHRQLHDKITDSYTFEAFTSLVEENLYRTNDKYFLGVFNIRNFKIYNELYGFEYGNKVLREVTKTISSVYENAYVARLRDDHFLIFDKYINNDDLESSFKKIISKLHLLKIPGNELLNLQEGVYILNDNKENFNDCLDKARLALSAITNNLVQDISLFNTEMIEKEIKEKKYTAHFAEALINHEFKLFLQPKFNSLNNQIIGAEALTRWNFLNKDLLNPSEYIEILETNKLIGSLDKYVFKDVCKYLRYRIDNKLNLFPISVNISKIFVDDTSYFDNLEEIRKKYKIDSNLIEFEITESIYVKNYAKVTNLLNYIKKFGYRISIDDFGSGYSNLELLSREEFDEIKIDKSLVSDITESKKKIILGHLISLFKSLNLDMICEGVENELQKEFLNNMGCNKIQGYLYSKPICIEEFNKKYN